MIYLIFVMVTHQIVQVMQNQLQYVDLQQEHVIQLNHAMVFLILVQLMH